MLPLSSHFPCPSPDLRDGGFIIALDLVEEFGMTVSVSKE